MTDRGRGPRCAGRSTRKPNRHAGPDEIRDAPELRRLAKTLRRWRAEILSHHSTGASNGPVEAANLTIKQVKRSGRGFRNLDNYRLRILLAGGANPLRETHPVTSIRPRRPRLVA